MASSSCSTAASISFSRYSAALIGQLGRDVDDLELGAQGLVLPDDRLHARPGRRRPTKSASAPIGNCSTSGVAPRRSTIMSTQRKKSAPMRSILLTKHMRGTLVLVGLAPDRLGLRLDAGDRVEDRDRAVEHAQRALDLDGEVDVARRVDDVDPVVVPETGRRGRGDGDAALLLLLHPVHGGGAVVDLADLVGLRPV